MATPKPTVVKATANPVVKQVAPVQQTRKEALGSLLQKGANSQVQSQEALLAQARDKQLLEIQKGLETAVNEGKISVRDAEDQFNAQKTAINKEAYIDTERTELMSQERGIGNSMQMLGLQQGDNQRKNTMINENVSVRDQRINTITDRLNAIKNNSALDTANAHANYSQGVVGARAQADAQRFQNEFQMGLEDMQAQRDQGFTRDNMNMQQGFTQDNMQMQQDFDMTKMSKQQTYQLEQMAKSFGYDLSKMSKAQQYQLANMATSFGYDMSMQNDSQSHQSYQAEQSRTHEINMFGKQEASKLAEYGLALEREMASYDAGTPEGKLRIKQLESAQSSMLTEKMTGTIGELMGQSFIKQYGDGMTPEQMQKWLKDPTNMKNLDMKMKSSNLPPEKKSFVTMFKNAMLKTAPGKIYEAYSKAFREGLPSFTP